MNPLHIALSQAFNNKVFNKGYGQSAWAKSFIAQNTTMHDLYQHVIAGGAFTVSVCEDNHRKEKNFKSSHIAALDFDNNVSIQDCLNHPFIAQYASFVYPSASSGKQDDNGNAIHKSRPVFQLDREITDLHEYRRLVLALMYACQDLDYDPSCKDGVRLFFGSTNRFEDPVFLGHVLPVSVLEAIADDMETEHGVQETPRTDEMNILIRQRNSERLKDHSSKSLLERYASVALDNMISDLSSLGEGGGKYGGRNNTAFVYGAKCGNFTAANILSDIEAETSLIRAAMASGLSEFEAQTAISNGIKEGLNTPFDTDAKLKEWADKKSVNRAYNKAAIAQGKAVDEVANKRKKEITDFQAARKQKMIDLLGYDPDYILYDKPAFPGGVARWVDSDHLPIGLISAILNLSKGVLPLVFVKLHQALTLGALRPHFTIKELSHITGVSRVTLPKVINLLSEWGFVKKLGVYIYNTIDSISKDMSQESLQNSGGRPAEYYSIDDKWQDRLYHALQVFFVEKFFGRTVTTDLSQLIKDLSLSDIEAEQFRDRARLAKDKGTLESRKAYRQEMYGDNHNWNGWENALKSNACLEIDWRDVLDMKQMRAAILREWVIKYRAINTIDEQKRLLGCSETTISNIRPFGAVKSILQPSKLTFDAPEKVRDLAAKFRATATELRAAIWQVKFKDDEGWGGSYNANEYLKQFAKGIHRIKEVLFIMNTPSKQVIVSGEEIAHTWFIWRMKILELALVYQGLLQAQVIDEWYMQYIVSLWWMIVYAPHEMLTISNSHKPNVTFESNETYLVHSTKWLFKQLRLHIHAYTPDLELWPSLHLVRPMADGLDGCAELVQEFETLNEVNTYLNKHSSLRPCRDVASFYGKHYDEEIDMEELEKEAAKRKEWVGSDTDKPPIVAIPPQNIKPVQIELPTWGSTDTKIDMTQSKYYKRYVERPKRPTLAQLRSQEYWQKKVGA